MPTAASRQAKTSRTQSHRLAWQFEWRSLNYAVLVEAHVDVVSVVGIGESAREADGSEGVTKLGRAQRPFESRNLQDEMS